MLTDEQQLFFDTFGFLVRRQVFTPDEMDVISREFEVVMEEDRQGAEFPGEKRHGVIGFVEKRPALTRLADDDRIFLALEELMGPGFVWIASDGNLYVGNTHWHSDGSNPYMRIKVAFYLDPVRKDTGCLRVVPGSHRAPLHDQLRAEYPAEEAADSPYGVGGAELPGFPLESNPGDVVFFNQNLWHSSWGGRTGRRMFTMNFGSKPTTEDHYEHLRHDYETNRQDFIPRMQFTQSSRIHNDAFLNSDSPRIREMVAYLVERGLT